jgi:hypothetical protein
VSWFNRTPKVNVEAQAAVERAVQTHLIEARLRDVLAGIAIPADVQERIHQLFADAHAGDLTSGEKK